MFGLFDQTRLFLKGDEVVIKYHTDEYGSDYSYLGDCLCGCRIECICIDDDGEGRIDVSLLINEAINLRMERSVRCSDILEIGSRESMEKKFLKDFFRTFREAKC